MDTVQIDTVQISLPIEWRERVKARVVERGQSSTADYIRQLVAKDIEPQYVDEETERLILEGLDSPLEGPVDAQFWADRHRKLDEALKAKTP